MSEWPCIIGIRVCSDLWEGEALVLAVNEERQTVAVRTSKGPRIVHLVDLKPAVSGTHETAISVGGTD